MTDWTHNGLLRDLADHCRQQGRLVFTDQLMGPAGSCRPDVLAINKSYTRWNPTVYEIKVSRSDFLSDVKSGKWAKYYDAASAVSFAVPAGLVKKTEVPEKAGLIIRHDNAWRYAKKPTIEPIDNLDRFLWMALVMQLDGWNKQGNIRPREADFSRAAERRHELGEQIRAFLNDSGGAEHRVKQLVSAAECQLENAKVRADDLREKAKQDNPLVLDAVKKVFAEYGVTYQTGYGISSQLERMMDGLKQRFDADERLSTAKKHIRQAADAIGA